MVLNNNYVKSFDKLVTKFYSDKNRKALGDNGLVLFTQRNNFRDLYDDFYLRDRLQNHPTSIGVAIKNGNAKMSLKFLRDAKNLLRTKNYDTSTLENTSLSLGGMYSIPMTLLYTTSYSDLLERPKKSIQAKKENHYVEITLITSGISSDLRGYFSDNLIELIQSESKNIEQDMGKTLKKQNKIVITYGKTRNGMKLRRLNGKDVENAFSTLRELLSLL